MMWDDFAAMWTIDYFVFLFQMGHLDFSQINASLKRKRGVCG
jgi:hypothetical protein